MNKYTLIFMLTTAITSGLYFAEIEQEDIIEMKFTTRDPSISEQGSPDINEDIKMDKHSPKNNSSSNLVFETVKSHPELLVSEFEFMLSKRNGRVKRRIWNWKRENTILLTRLSLDTETEEKFIDLLLQFYVYDDVKNSDLLSDENKLKAISYLYEYKLLQEEKISDLLGGKKMIYDNYLKRRREYAFAWRIMTSPIGLNDYENINIEAGHRARNIKYYNLDSDQQDELVEILYNNRRPLYKSEDWRKRILTIQSESKHLDQRINDYLEYCLKNGFLIP